MPEGDATIGELAASPAEETTSPVVTEVPPTQTPEPGTPPTTPSEPVGEEPPFHTHPRWMERQREVESLREQNRQLMELATRATQPVATMPQADPLQGLVNHPDPATAQFWQQVKTVAESIADRKAQERVQPLAQMVGLGRQELAQMTLTQFRGQNPDILPGSSEEAAIARLILPPDGSQGLPLEYAKRVVMYDKLASRVEKATQAQTTQRNAQKRVATPEATQGIPAAAGGPTVTKSFRETMDEELRKEGL